MFCRIGVYTDEHGEPIMPYDKVMLIIAKEEGDIPDYVFDDIPKDAATALRTIINTA